MKPKAFSHGPFVISQINLILLEFMLQNSEQLHQVKYFYEQQILKNEIKFEFHFS